VDAVRLDERDLVCAMAMFSGVWPVARLKCSAIRALLSGAETAEAGKGLAQRER